MWLDWSRQSTLLVFTQVLHDLLEEWWWLMLDVAQVYPYSTSVITISTTKWRTWAKARECWLRCLVPPRQTIETSPILILLDITCNNTTQYYITRNDTIILMMPFLRLIYNWTSTEHVERSFDLHWGGWLSRFDCWLGWLYKINWGVLIEVWLGRPRLDQS